MLEAQAAPALAESARKLGMIPSRDTAHLVQDPAGNWIVVGTPKPAEGVPPPPLNTPLPDETPAPPPPPPRAACAAGRRSPRDGRPGTGRPAPATRLPRAGRPPHPRRRSIRRASRWPCRLPRQRRTHRGQPHRAGPARAPADTLTGPLPRAAARCSYPPQPRPPSSSPAPSPAPDVSPQRRSASVARHSSRVPPRAASARARRTREPVADNRFPHCVFRVPAPGRQRRHLPGACSSPRRSCSTCRCRARPGCAPRRRASSRSPTSTRRCAAASSTATTTSWPSPSRPAH